MNARRWVRGRGDAAACALVGLLVFQFFGNATFGYIPTRSLFWWWAYQWFDPAADSQQGVLILAVAIWLFWRNLRTRPGLRGPTGRSAEGHSGFAVWPSAFAMLGGMALHLLGYAVQQPRISIVALLFFTWGVLGVAGGRRWMRAGAFPLAFLGFAIPFNALDTLGFYLRMDVIDAAYAVAHRFGLEVVRNGTQLFSPHGGYQYDVAAACSGVRSLLALAALSLLAGYLSFRSWWVRTLLLVLSVPYAFVGNVVRIFAIIVAAEWLGQNAGYVVHEWFGFLVFVVVVALQQATISLLKRAAKPADRAATGGPVPREEAGGSLRPRAWMPTTAAVLAAALVIGATRAIDGSQLSPEVGIRLAADGREPVPLPVFLGPDWIGQAVPVSAMERAILPPDTGYSRMNYISVQDRARQVYVSIVLSGRDRTSIHRPELCLVGQGWTIERRFSHGFRGSGADRAEIPATMLQVRHEAVLPDGRRVAFRSLVAYWFVGHDRLVATNWERMWWGLVDRLRHLRSERWAYVLVQTGAADGDAAATARLQTVLDQVLPVFQKPRSP